MSLAKVLSNCDQAMFLPNLNNIDAAVVLVELLSLNRRGYG